MYNNSMRIKKTTRRHLGHVSFTHYIEYIYANANKFVEHRQWCWETWGPSCELEYTTDSTRRWCWMSESGPSRIRIYFASQTEASHFALKWS